MAPRHIPPSTCSQQHVVEHWCMVLCSSSHRRSAPRCVVEGPEPSLGCCSGGATHPCRRSGCRWAGRERDVRAPLRHAHGRNRRPSLPFCGTADECCSYVRMGVTTRWHIRRVDDRQLSSWPLLNSKSLLPRRAAGTQSSRQAAPTAVRSPHARLSNAVKVPVIRLGICVAAFVALPTRRRAELRHERRSSLVLNQRANRRGLCCSATAA
jgi:hypothetical protein